MTHIDNEITLDTPLYRCVLKKSYNVTRLLYYIIIEFIKGVGIPFILPVVVTVYLLLFSNVLPYVVILGREFGLFLLGMPVWITIFACIIITILVGNVSYSLLWCLEKRSKIKPYSELSLKLGIPLALFQDSGDGKIVSVAIPHDKYTYGMIDIVFHERGGRNRLTDIKLYGDYVLEPFRCSENMVLVLKYLDEQLHIPPQIVILSVDEYYTLPNPVT